MALDIKNLELAATAISIAAGCIPCTRYHIGEARKAGAGEPAILLALSAGSGTAAAVHAATADQFGVDSAPAAGGQTQTAGDESSFLLLCRLGAAIALNNTAIVQRTLKEGRAAGFSDTELYEIAVLSAAIKQKAASHVARITGKLDADAAAAGAAGALCS